MATICALTKIIIGFQIQYIFPKVCKSQNNKNREHNVVNLSGFIKLLGVVSLFQNIYAMLTFLCWH